MIQLTLCPNCNRIVSDPICVKCYLREFVLWLNDQDIPLPQRNAMMKMINKNLMPPMIHGQLCILCENHDTSLCSYCFFFNIKIYLERLNIPEEVIDNYMLSFNYEIPTMDHEEDLYQTIG